VTRRACYVANFDVDALCCLESDRPLGWNRRCDIHLSYFSIEKMANKEATVYIIDVGNRMERKDHGRAETNLQWCMQYVWDRLTTTVSIASNFQKIFVDI
jgi:hypothetical protein